MSDTDTDLVREQLALCNVRNADTIAEWLMKHHEEAVRGSVVDLARRCRDLERICDRDAETANRLGAENATLRERLDPEGKEEE